MTNEEAKKMLEAKLKCLIAETSGTNHDCNMRLCDGCSLNYEQGNMGEQKQALDMAIKALEQQPCEDCISREAVLLLQTESAEKMGATTFWKLRDDIRALPSVTPQPSEDCVKREDVKSGMIKYGFLAPDMTVTEFVEDCLPSVTPTSEDIKEAYLKGYEYGVKDWFKSKTQPCEDAVSREEVQDLISRWLSDYLLDETREALETINYKVGDMPSVTPERPKGKWLHIYKSDIACECSVCHIQMPITEYFHYCPNCGSNMSGGGEDENNFGR